MQKGKMLNLFFHINNIYFKGEITLNHKHDLLSPRILSLNHFKIWKLE